eukprot:1216969-Amphidinium_carterae.3
MPGTSEKSQKTVRELIEELGHDDIKLLTQKNMIMSCTAGPDHAVLVPAGWIAAERTGVYVSPTQPATLHQNTSEF